eukprot:NODE_230_length_12188_cov_0.969890.p4 type:complete len:438 gc:universal NODE_230_length_12188_cov_0.969890:1972-659(-)
MRFNTDARFQRPKSNETKLQLDERFKKVLDNSFYEMSKTDKFGIRKNEEAGFMKKQFDYDLDSNSTESETSEIESVIEAVEVDEILQEDITYGDPTSRLALVNIDWENVKAQDLFVLFQSFVDNKEEIESVFIYISEFGRNQMELEEKNGPPNAIFNENGTEEEPFDMVQLRKYQLERMKYYYAIATFSSKDAAMKVFDSCDGQELELTGNLIDLRYVSDCENFGEDLSHIFDKCTSRPIKYENLAFETKSLQHSNVKLTWDDEIDRKKLIERISNGDLDAAKDLIASGSDMDVNDAFESEILPPPKMSPELKLDIEFKPIEEELSIKSINHQPEDKIPENGDFDMRDVLRSSKVNGVSKWKKKKIKKLLDSSKIDQLEAQRMLGETEDNFTLDTGDERFSKIFTDSEYHIDTGDSKYKKTKNAEHLLSIMRNQNKY